MIYLDNAATTYPKPEQVYQEMMLALREKGANPGRGAYSMALEASKVIFNTRKEIASLIGAQKPEEIVFTANATEAINLALKGVLLPGEHVITTSMEHNSVIRPLKYLETQGISLTIVKANVEGIVDPADIEKNIVKNTKLVVVTHASNVCGSINPIEAIGEIARKHKVIFAIDAAQSIGYLPIDVQKMNVDLLAFPGHKGLYGPFGTGGLYIKTGLVLQPLKEGGTGVSSVSREMPDALPERYEAGTLNVPGIAGLGAGVRYIKEIGLDEIVKKGTMLTSLLLEKMQEINKIKIYCEKIVERVPVVSFNFDEIDAAEAALILDKKYQIAVRAGLHCAPLAHETIGTLNTGTVRVSLSSFNTVEDIEALISAIKEISEM